MAISNDTEKAFDRIPYPFTKKKKNAGKGNKRYKD